MRWGLAVLAAINKCAAYVFASALGLLGAIAFMGSGLFVAAWVCLLLSPTVAVAIHESGHALAAWRLGMNVRAISVGPLILHLSPMRIGLSDKVLGYDVGGYVVHDESRGRYLTRTSDALITAAGPLANLLTGTAAYAVGRIIGEQPAGRLCLGFAFVSFAAFVISAWPFKLASGRGNDAYELVRLLANGGRRSWSFSSKPKRSPWQAP